MRTTTPTVSFVRHPALQLWPTHWDREGDAVATVVVARGERTVALSRLGPSGEGLLAALDAWLGDPTCFFSRLSIASNEAFRDLVIDGAAWIEAWSLSPRGWSRETTARLFSGPPSAEELDAAAGRIVEGLPTGLPIVPSRCLPDVAAAHSASGGGEA